LLDHKLAGETIKLIIGLFFRSPSSTAKIN